MRRTEWGPLLAETCRLATEYLENLRAMIMEAQRQEAKVILMTTNPLRWTPKIKDLYGKPPYHPEEEEGFDSLHLAAYNETLRKLAAELKVPLVDVRAAYPAWAASRQAKVDALLLDGMHPNDPGHQLVSELLAPVVLDAVR